ncbi:MAG: hypothetical protein RBS43_08420 [Candidatus Cloacimonas sp.]|jgi:hypothetical protein|nr:hypothetical protein [Candidatus Cloacimonas sp.]
MKEKAAHPFRGSISQIVKISEAEGSGLLGFTITYSEADFQNVVQSFQPLNHDTILAEMERKRTQMINILNIKGRTR